MKAKFTVQKRFNDFFTKKQNIKYVLYLFPNVFNFMYQITKMTASISIEKKTKE